MSTNDEKALGQDKSQDDESAAEKMARQQQVAGYPDPLAKMAIMEDEVTTVYPKSGPR